MPRLDLAARRQYASKFMRPGSRKLLIAAAVVALLAFILYRSRAMFHFGDFSGARLFAAIRGANPLLLILSVLAIYGCYALRAARWQVFQKNLGPSHFWSIFGMTLAGFSAVFLLGRVGEPIRPLLLARKEKLPVSGMFGIYFLERLFDAASTAVVASIGLLLFQARHNTGEMTQGLQTAAKTTGVVLSLGVLAAIAFLIYLRVHGIAFLEQRLHAAPSHGVRARFLRILIDLAHGAQTIRTWGQLALAVLYSTAHWFLVLLVYLWVSHAFGGTLGAISLGDAMLVMAFTLVGSAVQVPGVGGGSQAGSIIAYTAIFGVEREPAVAAAVVVWLISFGMCNLVGLPLLIHQGWSLGELRQMAKAETASELASAPGEAAE